MKKFQLILPMFFIFSVQAKDLGVYGATFPIAEHNLETVIKERLKEKEKNGDIEKLNQQMIEQAKQKRDRPNLNGVKATTSITKERIYNQVKTIQKDLLDDKGKIVAYKGQSIDPLKFVSLTKNLYFIDGDDKNQIDWIKKQSLKLNDKVILTNGSTLDAENSLKRRIYFDQDGNLSKKIGINVVPSIFFQRDNQLIIREVSLNEKTN